MSYLYTVPQFTHRKEILLKACNPNKHGTISDREIKYYIRLLPVSIKTCLEQIKHESPKD